jgi:hypothetical protein
MAIRGVLLSLSGALRIRSVSKPLHVMDVYHLKNQYL